MQQDLNLVSALQSTIRHNRTRPAIIETDRVFTWEQFGERVSKLAGALRLMGITSGSRFAILSRNGFRVEELRWAGLWLRAIPIPINWRLAPPEIAAILDDADCKRVFVENAFTSAFEHVALGPWANNVIAFGEATGSNAPPYEALLEKGVRLAPENADPNEDALLLYTGGTTGRSKGVRLSHANVLSNAAAFGLGVGARRHQTYLHAAPMFHSADLLALPWMLQGAAQSYLSAFSPSAFLEAIERFRVGAVVTVPTMLVSTIQHPSFNGFNLSSLEILIYGAAPMAIEWIERVATAFPDVDFFNCYGLTETAPDLTIFDAAEFRSAIEEAQRTGKRADPLSAVGKPNLLCELRIVNKDGKELPCGQIGEIVARGPHIMKGYLNLADETGKVLRDGWFHTGDIGRIDEAGYVYLLDRLKDVVITGGENVYSSEVEAVLHRHEEVAEAAVIGVPDERLGELVMAVIVGKHEEKIDEEELSRHCREWLGGFKVPRRYAFVDNLPKSPLGKILKTTLRQQFAHSLHEFADMGVTHPAIDDKRRSA